MNGRNDVMILTLNQRGFSAGQQVWPQEIRKAAFVGTRSSFPSSIITVEWVQVFPAARIDQVHSARARFASKGGIFPDPCSL
jgi:hypothetical protein